MARAINPNFVALVQHFKSPKTKGLIMQGSSRSGKTISCVDFVIWYCINNSGKTINVVKETYNEFKTTLYDDFKKRLDDFGLDNPFKRLQEVSTFKIFGNKINFLGADNEKKIHGAGCDVLWVNEAIHVSKKVFDQAEMRCRDFWFMDFNPSATSHWIFDSVEKREDVRTIKTTFKDNPFISASERGKILSYEPTEKNILQGTADETMWKIYGLGEKAEIKGLIFNKWTTTNEPITEGYYYGLDFGYTTDPTALVKYKKEGNNIFCELLIYEPIPEPSLLIQKLEELKIEKHIPIICDSADRYVNEWGVKNYVNSLREADYEASKVSKRKSVMYWLGEMRTCNIVAFKNNLCTLAVKELENYRMQEINGISINKPIDKDNHFIDALRYAFMSDTESFIL